MPPGHEGLSAQMHVAVSLLTSTQGNNNGICCVGGGKSFSVEKLNLMVSRHDGDDRNFVKGAVEFIMSSVLLILALHCTWSSGDHD